MGGKCQDPCNCGENAFCNVIEHRPICTCQPGYEGDPEIACTTIGCISDTQCSDDRLCYENNCISPCILDNPCAPHAECHAAAHKAVCLCPSGYDGNPLKECKIAGCTTNSDCPSDRMCLNGRCLDQCIYNNKCAPEAQCRSINHQTECRCPAGLSGDPTIACFETKQPVCHSDYDCDVDFACMDGLCQQPCKLLDPCQEPTVCQLVPTRPLKTMTCTCPNHMVTSHHGQCVDCKHD
ncbi:hypothetical protein E2C01_044299 [Portunus trituberculatus]|uniref:EGF-like domain-containing protein n=1 Tax=Portunus trituberculatus TaxID=210409 RepID=A0A5B7FRR8_PORTR|nr:hypothetical protein [Portunus trituberculatus]